LPTALGQMAHRVADGLGTPASFAGTSELFERSRESKELLVGSVEETST